MWQMRRTTRKKNVLFSCWSLLCFLPASFGCLLCPLHIPAQPKPLDQFRIPSIEKLVQTAEIFESLCHNGSRLSDVSVECRAEVSHLFCSLSELIASMKTDCPGPEDESECTKCRSSNDQRYGASKWILTWLDSVGKMPSGISDGNYHWLGDYEQCQRLKSQQLFNGRYCLLEFHVPDAVMRPDQCLERSADPLEIVLGICLPANCSADETRGLVQLTSPGLQLAGLSCEPEAQWPWPSLLLTGLCLLWLAILLLVSALHWLKPSLPLPEALCIQIHLRHSLRTTAAPARAGAKQFLAISGLQVLTVSLLVMGQAQVLVLPYLENIGRHYALLERWTTQPMLNPTLLADSLLALSAFQLAIGPSSRSLVQTLWRRFIRFWPAYAFVSLVMAFVFARLGEGPMWSRTDIGQRCAANWLPNLLMVQNLLGHSYTCLDAGQLLALEAQFLLLSLLTLLALGGRPRFLSAVLSVGLVASAGFVLAVCLLFGLPPTLVPHRRMEAHLFGPLADFLVLNPVARLGPPLVGLLFGLRLRPRLDSWQHLLRALAPGGSLCVLLGLGLLLWAPFWLPAGPSPQGLLYATLHRPAWAALLLALLLLIEANSKRGVLAKFLGWRVFRPLAKQTFPVLWLAEPVALSLFSSLHRPVHATPLSASLSFVGILVCSTLLAFAIDVTLSRPIRHFLLGHADQARADGKQMRGGEEEEEAEVMEPNQNEMGKEDKR